MTMTTDYKASLELKRLREHAGYSVRQFAAALREAGSEFGQSPSSYAYYENGYKKPYLPVELVDSLTPLLVGRGSPPIGEGQVFALAGWERGRLWKLRLEFTEKQNTKTKAQIEADLLAEIIQGIALELEALSLDLTKWHHARLVAEVYNRITATGDMHKPGSVAWEVAYACRIAKSVLQSDS